MLSRVRTRTCYPIPRRRDILVGELHHAERQDIESPKLWILLELADLLAHMNLTIVALCLHNNSSARKLAFDMAADIEPVIVGAILGEDGNRDEQEKRKDER